MTAILETKGLSVSFGGVQALVDVDLKVKPGQLVGLIGPNGAGKTSFIDAITGFVRYSGSVRLDGRDLGSLPPHGRAALGLARTWQSIELFDDLTVRENLVVASHRPSAWATVREVLSRPVESTSAVEQTAQMFGLGPTMDALPDELSQGQRKLVGIARALAAQPRLLCLDEPAAGLDSGEGASLGRRLRQIVDAGTAMLLVDHDMRLVLSIADAIVVLEFGEVIAEGPPEAVRHDERVIAAYLGNAPRATAGR